MRHWDPFITGFGVQGVCRENSAPQSFALSKSARVRRPARVTKLLHLFDMRNLLSSLWRLLIRAPNRRHDAFLVYSMTSFNSGGGWNEFLLKASLQNT